jgi:hypothetical protein
MVATTGTEDFPHRSRKQVYPRMPVGFEDLATGATGNLFAPVGRSATGAFQGHTTAATRRLSWAIAAPWDS